MIEDPRIERTRRHRLIDILVTAICGIISGCDSWVEIEEFGKATEAWFRGYLKLEEGIPSHDRFGRVFSQIKPEEFQRCFYQWVQEVSQITDGEIIAIDGKTNRGSHDRSNGKKAIHLPRCECLGL